MPTPLSGPGVGLPYPQNLYPSELANAPYDPSSNRICLAPGQSLVLPAGNWYVNTSNYCVIQYLDPVTGVWAMGGPGATWTSGIHYVKSDGFNARVANLTGCLFAAVITNAGSSYVQASTTVTVTGSTGLVTPIVGGQLALSGGTLTNNGAGYGVAPLVFIPPPPNATNNANGVGGIQAAAYATISSGTVSGITFTNVGAGYPTAPVPVIVPSPFDPNLSVGITQATAAFSLTGSGSITGLLVTQNGAPITPANITLTINGAGSSATATASVLQTITSATVSSAGATFTGPFGVQTTGGGLAGSPAISASPDALNIAFRPRPAQITAASVTAGFPATILDGGLFASAPTPVSTVAAGTGGTIATWAFAMGSKQDIITIQPAP